MKRLLVIAGIAWCSSACATFWNSDRQSIPVATNPPGATVKVGNKTVVTPGVLDLDRSDGGTLEISKPGYKTSTIVMNREVSNASWLNCLCGSLGLIGVGVDFLTGGAYTLSPERVDLTLEKLPPPPAPPPAPAPPPSAVASADDLPLLPPEPPPAPAPAGTAALFPLNFSRARLEEADRFALDEAVRSSLGNAFAAHGFSLVPKEAIADRLKVEGPGQPCEGRCALEIARESHANVLLTGAVMTSEGVHIAFLWLFEVPSGRPLATLQVEGETAAILRARLAQQAAGFVEQARNRAPTGG